MLDLTPMLDLDVTVGPQAEHKVFTLQTLPACDEPLDDGVGKVVGLGSPLVLSISE